MESDGRQLAEQPLPVEGLQGLEAKNRGTIEQIVGSAVTGGIHDVDALRQLANYARSNDCPDAAERLLRQAIAQAPGSIAAYADLTSLLCCLQRADEAVALLIQAVENHPRQVWPLSLKAAALSVQRRADEALDAYEAVVRHSPHASVPWMNYGQALQTVGRVKEAVAAYQKSLQLDPDNGSAWWGLAGLRTFEFKPSDLAEMERVRQTNARNPLQAIHLHFALGRASDDLGRYEQAFRYYEEAQRLRSNVVSYDPASISEFVRQSATVFSDDFFKRTSTQRHGGKEAIFIVGMPRSGSTLVEQILASHPSIEGLGELFDLQRIAARAGVGDEGGNLPEAIAELNDAALTAMGEEYMHSVQQYRRTDRPLFTDKMPSNWQFVPLIRLILPEAKIIDVRRNPLACCLSSFATYFNRETCFPSNLPDIARYYRDYVRMMMHVDAVLPGQVHRVDYDKAVEDLDREVRRLLEFIGLPFYQSCLKFEQNSRPVHTPSAQQVRRPLDRAGLNHWRNYEHLLESARDILPPIPQ